MAGNSDLDLRDLLLEVQAEFSEMVNEFAQELAQPLLAQAAAMKWASLTPEQKEMIKEKYPDIYHGIESVVNNAKGSTY